MGEQITYEIKEGNYGVICLNRPEKRNAISVGMAEMFMEKLEQAEQDELKFLIITGAGDRMFCAGGDLKDLHGDLSNEEAFTRLSSMLDVLRRILDFPVPVMALLNGDALGGGCELATACDIRIAKENTKFGFIQTNIGILPGWGGGAVLYKKVLPSFALHWIATGDILSATELQHQGWIQTIVDEKNWAKEAYLDSYKKKTVEQMRLLKTQFRANIQSAELPMLMAKEVEASASLWDSKEHLQALEKFSQRKK